MVPEQNAIAVPDGVDLATAAVLTCAGMTAVHATTLSGLRLGDTAVVDGIGGVGILVVQAAAHAGARVIAVADSEDKLQLAKDHGAADGVLVDEAEALRDLARARARADGRTRDGRVLRARRHDAGRWRRRPLAGQVGTVRLDRLHRPIDRASTRSSSSCPRPPSSRPSPRRASTAGRARACRPPAR